MSRDCECPSRNPDCEHPTCPRYPQPGHLRGEFLGDLAAVVGQNSLGAFAMDLDRLITACVVAELRRVAEEIEQDGDAANLMEYDELAGGHHRSAQLVRIRAEQMEPHQ